MPAKKVQKGVKAKVARRVQTKTSAAKKAPGKKETSVRKTTVVRKKGVSPKQPAKRVAAGRVAPKRISLGRPKVTGEEKLYLLFREDYHARQIFEFLRVETVKELEQFSPQQIVDRLSAPIVETVHRIRKTLAAQNRALADDQAFAAQHKQSTAAR